MVPEDGPEPAALGEQPRLAAADVAEQAGIPLERARRMWRTLGFPEHGDALAYTEADVDALRMMATIVERGGGSFDKALNMARGIGLTMARLADWEVAELYLPAEPDAGEGAGEHGSVVDQLGTEFEDILRYAWRQHLAAAVARMESVRTTDADPHSVDLSVGFADIVGFTALSNDLTRERIGELVEVFESRCGDVISGEGGRLIKSMGDAVLYVNDDPMAALKTAEGIINVIGRDPRMPDVRVGLATGGVVLRLGDVFGPPVNLAARLTQVARRNRVIVDAATAALLPAEAIETRPLPPRPLRGFGVLEPVAVRRI